MSTGFASVANPFSGPRSPPSLPGVFAQSKAAGLLAFDLRQAHAKTWRLPGCTPAAIASILAACPPRPPRTETRTPSCPPCSALDEIVKGAANIETEHVKDLKQSLPDLQQEWRRAKVAPAARVARPTVRRDPYGTSC